MTVVRCAVCGQAITERQARLYDQEREGPVHASCIAVPVPTHMKKGWICKTIQ